MSLLSFLKQVGGTAEIRDRSKFEYHLVCSGRLFSGDVLTFDWRKSDATRDLLTEPFVLLIAGRADDFPQEIALRFTMGLEERTHSENSHSIGYFDEEIAGDIAALLTVLLRRLVSVGPMVRRQHLTEMMPETLRDFPNSVVNRGPYAAWPQHPVVFLHWPDGIKMRDYNPPSLAVFRRLLKETFLRLPDSPNFESVLKASRLYQAAMEFIQSRIEISYQLLISAVETLATVELKDWTPAVEEVLKNNRVQQKAIELGLSEQIARQLGLASIAANPWTRRKFVRFIEDRIPEDFWTTQDSLYGNEFSKLLEPQRPDFARALNRIYSARSGASHQGEAFPLTSRIGPGPLIRGDVAAAIVYGDNTLQFPPVIWFERVVNIVMNRMISDITDVREPLCEIEETFSKRKFTQLDGRITNPK